MRDFSRWKILTRFNPDVDLKTVLVASTKYLKFVPNGIKLAEKKLI